MKNYELFKAYKTQTAGVWFFVPESGVFKKGKPCKGFGCIKYAEGSVYTGDIYYDGEDFNKIGNGRQEFTHSVIGDIIPGINEKKYIFVGKYDYRKTDWIYGNGVLYYTDAAGKPTHFMKGFFVGLAKNGEYKGEFDYGTLLEGYTQEMEIDYDEDSIRREARWRTMHVDADRAESVDTLFIGDSYFELFGDKEFAGGETFDKVFPAGYINAGIGGSKFIDWIGWEEQIKTFPKPQRIVINLGFNDLHSGRSVNRTYSDFLKLNKILKGYFPQAEIYLISVIHSPYHTNHLDAENALNAKFAANAKKNGVTVGEWNSRIKESGVNCFHTDGTHPNEYGYGLYADFIKELINKN